MHIWRSKEFAEVDSFLLTLQDQMHQAWQKAALPNEPYHLTLGNILTLLYKSAYYVFQIDRDMVFKLSQLSKYKVSYYIS